MSSKREEEKNEKIIRGLLKLPPNRRCINCNGLGPQYVCTNFWTFVCTACSGIHREFTHRVKSVSMAKFTAQEVEALQNGGNQRAKELFLKDWDMQSMKLPDSSYPDKIREFIKNVYLEKKYATGRSSDKPPKDLQGLQTHEEHRRASSYHSFSQSPPYDHQYEDRRYGKPRVMLTRKPGSDHGHYEGNISSILYSPGRDREHLYEDRFANESSSSRTSDYSVSKSSDQSSSTCAESSTHRSVSLGSFGSFDSNSLYPKSVNSGATSVVFSPDNAPMSQQPNKFGIASSETSNPQHAAAIDLFSVEFLQQQNISTSMDLFANFCGQTSSTSSSENKPLPSSENEGWAMFDVAPQVEPIPKANESFFSTVPSCMEGPTEIIDTFSSKQDTSQLSSAQNFPFHGETTGTADQWHTGFVDPSSVPIWNAFGESFQKNSSHENHPLVNGPSIFGGQHTDVALPKVLNENGLQSPVALNKDHLQNKNSSERMTSVTLPCEASGTQEWKSKNPFDLSFDLDKGTSNVFLDMSSLQGVLPNAPLPNAFLDGLSQPWFQHNSAQTFNPSIPQAGLPFAGGQISSSPLPNLTSQGSGNPFA